MNSDRRMFLSLGPRSTRRDHVTSMAQPLLEGEDLLDGVLELGAITCDAFRVFIAQ
jgi:hypothetical protein